MNSLKPELLVSSEYFEFDYDAILKEKGALGTYNPMRFVVRLRKDVHQMVIDNNSQEFSYERAQAFSTFIHENIHWWQHVGSNIGFLLSMSYPAIAHMAHSDLKAMIQRNEKYKSIMEYDKYYFEKRGKYDNVEINTVLNTWHDIQYAKWFIYDNKNISRIAEDKRFFISVGHSFYMLWVATLSVLTSTFDPTNSFLPNVNTWVDDFKKLREEKAEGFGIDESTYRISRIGTRAIFEGQARFNQLQYLAIGSKSILKYSDFEKIGMLSGIYVEAFNLFLKITSFDRPTDLNSSIVGLFLLVCDIAINPTDGFPIEPFYFKTFIVSNDPGLRFVTLCNIIARDKAKWVNAVKEYSAEEYIRLSNELCQKMVCFSPTQSSLVVSKWKEKSESIRILLEEENKMKFTESNLSIRLFFSKFILFQEDKLKYPNVFCWIGKCMTSEAHSDLNFGLVEKLFNKHKALFIGDIDGEIKPMVFEGYAESNVHDTFNAFYAYNVMYDMTVQWIKESGEFVYDFRWLSPKHNYGVMKKWVQERFKGTYGIYPEQLKIL